VGFLSDRTVNGIRRGERASPTLPLLRAKKTTRDIRVWFTAFGNLIALLQIMDPDGDKVELREPKVRDDRNERV